MDKLIWKVRRIYHHTPSEMIKRFLFYVHSAGCYVCGPMYDIRRKRGEMTDYQLKYVVRGSGYVVSAGKTYKVREGQIFLLQLDTEHRYYANPDEPWELLWIRYGGVQALLYYELLRAERCPVYDTGDSRELLENSFRQALQLLERREAHFEVRLSSLLHHISGELLCVQRNEMENDLTGMTVQSYRKEIDKAVDYLETNYRSSITLEQVAEKASISKYHFARLFKQSTGYTYSEYLMKYRLTQAKRLLLQCTSLSIWEVAEQTGFADNSYFSKVFKRYEGMSPKDYRRVGS